MSFESEKNQSEQFELHEDVCNRVVQCFLPGSANSLQIELGGAGFSGALVYRVSTINDVYALRRWPRPTLPEARIIELHRFLQHLKDFGLSVAVPLIAPQSNRSVLQLNGHLWQIEPWLPGQVRQGEELSEVELRSMMQTVAKLHLASSRYVATPSGMDWFTTSTSSPRTINERLTLIENWTYEKLQSSKRVIESAPHEFRDVCCAVLSYFTQHAAPLRESLRKHSRQAVTLFPCWRDLWSEHVLFTDEGVSGLIDPNATRTDHVATDLSRLLGSFFGDDKQHWWTALDAYQQVRPLSQFDYELIDLFDRTSVLLSGLTWVQRWQNNQLPTDRIDEVLSRLRRIEQRMQNL